MKPRTLTSPASANAGPFLISVHIVWMTMGFSLSFIVLEAEEQKSAPSTYDNTSEEQTGCIDKKNKIAVVAVYQKGCIGEDR
ncbi:hypothetical protein U9M48_041764 [Paspalum notatum var. saurae]|uniref:Uncharacterized protein n=1 Tax=Paspalum notatum var. saurae TaxID=547442 RepID=A0AAQ3UTC0_PASNO